MAPGRRRCSKKNRRTFHVSVFKYTPVPLPERDWAELHPDLISCILHRLDQAELLIGGVAGVCRSWRRAAREEPELWRRIDLRDGLCFVPPFRTRVSLPTMVRAALRYSAGQCEAFLGEFINDDILLVLGQGATSLKSLHLITSSASNKGFAKAIKMLPLLEELEISLCEDMHTSEVVELVAAACPLLKHFRLVTPRNYQNGTALAASMVARMHKLRSLHLVGLDLDNKGLAAILENCQDLQYLNMRLCSPIVMDGNLRLELARINMDDREYSSDNYNFYEDWLEDWLDRSQYWPYGCGCCFEDDSYDTYDYSMCGSCYIDDIDLEEYEKILDIKSMRRYIS